MSEAFEIVKTGIDFFCSHLVFFNMLFAIVIVFFQRPAPGSEERVGMAAFVVFYTGTGIRVLSVTGAGYAQAENVPDQRGGGSHQQRYKTAGVPAEIPGCPGNG